MGAFKHHHPFWKRLWKAAEGGRLSPRDVATWFGVPYDTAFGWLRMVQGRRGPWCYSENLHKLIGLENAVKDGALPLSAPAKSRNGAIRKLSDEYNGGISAPDPAEGGILRGDS